MCKKKNIHETFRKKFKPRKVKILFVGESRPNSGNFFYYTNTDLYKYTKEAFVNAGIDFSLERFKDLSCWLYDVCDFPVNQLKTPAEKKLRDQYIAGGWPALEKTINRLKPTYIIVVKKGSMNTIIYKNILSTQFIHKTYVDQQDQQDAFNLPFPGMTDKNRNDYVSELTAIIKDALAKNIIP